MEIRNYPYTVRDQSPLETLQGGLFLLSHVGKELEGLGQDDGSLQRAG